MKRIAVVGLLLAALSAILLIGAGCGAVGANIRLEKLSRGVIAMDGRPLDGLPSDRINLDLDVAAQTIKVSTNAGKTILTLVPSGATITIEGDSVSFQGLKPEQVKVEWAVKPEE
jgi:hypothetical protein